MSSQRRMTAMRRTLRNRNQGRPPLDGVYIKDFAINYMRGKGRFKLEFAYCFHYNLSET